MDRDGFIDKRHLNKYKGNSENCANLKELVASDLTVHVTLITEDFQYADNNGNMQTSTMIFSGIDPDFTDPNVEYVSGTVNGETGRGGIALLPGKGERKVE